MLCKRGLDWTLVELNKAVSLSACTTMLMSFLPSFGEWSAELLFQSMSLLWAHSVYSSYKFYGGSVQRLLRDKPVKQLSIALGVAGQLALSAGFWGYVSDDALVLGASVLGLAHFYSMEIDYKGVLQVRLICRPTGSYSPSSSPNPNPNPYYNSNYIQPRPLSRYAPLCTVLQVRPYAYLPFAAGIPVLSYWALGRIRR